MSKQSGFSTSKGFHPTTTIPHREVLVQSTEGISILKSGTGYQMIFTDSVSIYNRHFRILIGILDTTGGFYVDFVPKGTYLKIYHFNYNGYPAYIKIYCESKTKLGVQVAYENASSFTPIQSYVYELAEIIE